MTAATRARRLAAVATAVLLTAAGLSSGAASAVPGDTVYYSVPFSSDLYVLEEGVPYGAAPTARRATPEEWSADGYPRPVRALTAYKAYEWSKHIYVEMNFDDLLVQAQYLNAEQWLRAGAPTPTRNSLIAGTVLLRYDTAEDLIVHNPSEPGDLPPHTLDYREWRRLGTPRPTFLPNQGFQKLSWSPVVTAMTDIWAGVGGPIAFEDWAALGYPRPQVVSRYPKDRFCSTPLSPDVRYAGPAYPQGVVLTYDQWRAAGSPTPTPGLC